MRGICVGWLHWTSRQALVILFVGCAPLLAVAEDLLFKRHVLSTETDYSAAALIDVNHDGQLDIVCGGDWYEAPDWRKHFVAEIPRISGRPDGFSHLAFDVNRDGWQDVITVNWRSRSIKWMEHPGPALGPWAVHTVVEPGPMESGRLVDIDRDGQLDLLPNGGRFAAWWEFRWNPSDGTGAPAWIRHELPAEAGGHGMGFGDIDGDGRGDIVGQNGWLEAPEDARYGEWQWHADFRLERASIPMIVADVDADGDNDVVYCSAHGYGVYWLEQTSDRAGVRAWHRHAIDTAWSQGHAPLWVDLDNDGRQELVVGKRYMAHGGADPGEYDPIAYYRYAYQPNTRTWQRWLVSPIGDRVGTGLDPKVGDIDGDGDLDLMASGRSGLYWLENIGPGDSSTLSPTTPKYNDHQTLLVVKGNDGISLPVVEPEGWGLRRTHILESIEQAHGQLPTSLERVPLDWTDNEEDVGQHYRSQRIRFRTSMERYVSARLLTPLRSEPGAAAGLVCLWDPASRQLGNEIARDLATRGMVCIVPEFAESDLTTSPIDAVWNAMRAADVLQALPTVYPERLAFVGDAMQGQLGMYIAALDPRFRVTITDAQAATEWIAANHEDAYSLSELMACAAPRGLMVMLPNRQQASVELARYAEQARLVFALRQVSERLVLTSDSWQQPTHRETTYAWLLKQLGQP